MIDIKILRETPDVVRKDLKRRNLDTAIVDRIVALDRFSFLEI